MQRDKDLPTFFRCRTQRGDICFVFIYFKKSCILRRGLTFYTLFYVSHSGVRPLRCCVSVLPSRRCAALGFLRWAGISPLRCCREASVMDVLRRTPLRVLLARVPAIKNVQLMKHPNSRGGWRSCPTMPISVGLSNYVKGNALIYRILFHDFCDLQPIINSQSSPPKNLSNRGNDYSQLFKPPVYCC